LTTLTLPNSVKGMGSSCFNNCSNLTSINFGDSLTAITYNSFNNCTGLTSLTFPKSVTAINWNTFNGCTNLTNITLSEKIKYIDWKTFNDCPNITEIHFLSKMAPPLFGDYGFFDVDKSNCKLYVPFGSSASYKSDQFWGSFSTIIEDATAISYPKPESVSISASEGGIHFQTQEAIPVVVYSLSGIKVFDRMVSNDEVVALKNGFYLVKALGKTIKVVVK